MRSLWERHGKTGEGVAEDGIFELLAELGHAPAAGCAETRTAPEDLPLARLLKAVGRLSARARADAAARLSVKLASGESSNWQACDDGAAQQAGLSAGDVLIAMDGLKVSSASEARLERLAPGDSIRIHVFVATNSRPSSWRRTRHPGPRLEAQLGSVLATAATPAPAPGLDRRPTPRSPGGGLPGRPSRPLCRSTTLWRKIGGMKTKPPRRRSGLKWRAGEMIDLNAISS